MNGKETLERELATELELARAGLERQRQKIEALEEANARLEELVFQRSLMGRISQVAQREAAVEPIARGTLELIVHVLQAPAAGILAWDGSAERIILAGAGPTPEFELALRAAWRMERNGRVPPLPAGDALFVPIRRGDELLGMLGAELPVTTQADPRQQGVMELFAGELGPLLERGFAVAQVMGQYQARLEFVRSLTHDLRNPLTGILSTLLSLGSGELRFRPEVHAKLTRNALESARELDRMLDDLLDVYLWEAGKLEIETVRCDLASLARESAAHFAQKASQAGLELDVVLSPGELAVRADERLLRRVIANLVANAVKFTPAGTIRVSASVADDRVVLRIDDTGRGIPDAARPHLFTAFYRGVALAHEVPGTGLGLAFCKGAAEGMDGRIWYERSALGGSAFCVALPAWAD